MYKTIEHRDNFDVIEILLMKTDQFIQRQNFQEQLFRTAVHST